MTASHAVTVANVSRQFTVPAGFHIGDLVVFQQVAVQTVIQSAVCFRLFLCNIQFCIRCHLGLFCFRIGRDQVSVRRGLCFDTALVGVRLGLFLLLLGLDLCFHRIGKGISEVKIGHADILQVDVVLCQYFPQFRVHLGSDCIPVGNQAACIVILDISM